MGWNDTFCITSNALSCERQRFVALQSVCDVAVSRRFDNRQTYLIFSAFAAWRIQDIFSLTWPSEI